MTFKTTRGTTRWTPLCRQWRDTPLVVSWRGRGIHFTTLGIASSSWARQSTACTCVTRRLLLCLHASFARITAIQVLDDNSKAKSASESNAWLCRALECSIYMRMDGWGWVWLAWWLSMQCRSRQEDGAQCFIYPCLLLFLVEDPLKFLFFSSSSLSIAIFVPVLLIWRRFFLSFFLSFSPSSESSRWGRLRRRVSRAVRRALRWRPVVLLAVSCCCCCCCLWRVCSLMLQHRPNSTKANERSAIDYGIWKRAVRSSYGKTNTFILSLSIYLPTEWAREQEAVNNEAEWRLISLWDTRDPLRQARRQTAARRQKERGACSQDNRSYHAHPGDDMTSSIQIIHTWPTSSWPPRTRLFIPALSGALWRLSELLDDVVLQGWSLEGGILIALWLDGVKISCSRRHEFYHSGTYRVTRWWCTLVCMCSWLESMNSDVVLAACLLLMSGLKSVCSCKCLQDWSFAQFGLLARPAHFENADGDEDPIVERDLVSPHFY